jgi:hypothetical protein
LSALVAQRFPQLSSQEVVGQAGVSAIGSGTLEIITSIGLYLAVLTNPYTPSSPTVVWSLQGADARQSDLVWLDVSVS